MKTILKLIISINLIYIILTLTTGMSANWISASLMFISLMFIIWTFVYKRVWIRNELNGTK